ncbi:MAG: NUDIX hydrolase, partial [Burkholderiales bacterium]|nr:NUDIX hydrolase [Burkholderiales bacterium]
QVINPGGQPGIYGLVHFKNISVGVMALDAEDHIWLVGQHRYPMRCMTWEIPEGGTPPDESPLDAAKRELKEEAGVEAQRWRLLCKMHPSNSVTDEIAFIYLAEGLSAGDNAPESSEADMQRRRVPLTEALRQVLDGEITDSISVVGILRLARMKGL